MEENQVIMELDYDDFIMLEQILSEKIGEMKSKLHMIDENKYLQICKIKGIISGMVDLL